MASGIYNRFKANLMNKELDLEADTIKGMLLDNSHSFVATHNTKSEIVANEISGTGYTAGGQALANKAVTQAAATKWDADDLSWTGTFSAWHLALYDDTLAGDDLICSIDFGGEKAVFSNDFEIIWDSAGIITLS